MNGCEDAWSRSLRTPHDLQGWSDPHGPRAIAYSFPLSGVGRSATLDALRYGPRANRSGCHATQYRVAQMA